MAITLPSVVGHKDKRELELEVNSKDDIINKKINERLNRREMMAKEYDKWAKTQLDPTLDK